MPRNGFESSRIVHRRSAAGKCQYLCEPVSCLACTRVHLVNRSTGKTLDENDEEAGSPGRRIDYGEDTGMGHSAAMTASIRACMSARFAWAHEDDGKCHFMTHRAVVGTPNAERLFSHVVLGLNQVGHSPLIPLLHQSELTI